MTWKELRDFLNMLKEDQLEDSVAVYDAESGELIHPGVI